jgi:hypothetical protein
MCENGRTTSEVLHFNMFGLYQSIDFSDKDSLSIISRTPPAVTPCSPTSTSTSTSPFCLIPSFDPNSQVFTVIPSTDPLSQLNFPNSPTTSPRIIFDSATKCSTEKKQGVALYSPVQKWSYLSKGNEIPYGLADGESLDEKYNHSKNLSQKKLIMQKLESLAFTRTYSTIEFV